MFYKILKKKKQMPLLINEALFLLYFFFWMENKSLGSQILNPRGLLH